MTCVPNEDSDQPGHSPSLIRDLVVRSVGSYGPKVLHAQLEDWSDWVDAQASDWVDAQADLSLRWAPRSFC